MIARPEDLNLMWACEWDKLYSVFLMDNEGMPEGIEYLNWFTYNVRGCDVSTGDLGFDFLPPYAFDLADVNPDAGTASMDQESDRKVGKTTALNSVLKRLGAPCQGH